MFCLFLHPTIISASFALAVVSSSISIAIGAKVIVANQCCGVAGDVDAMLTLTPNTHMFGILSPRRMSLSIEEDGGSPAPAGVTWTEDDTGLYIPSILTPSAMASNKGSRCHTTRSLARCYRCHIIIYRAATRGWI